jgi:hypothetical protein
MNQRIRQFERESHIDVYGLGLDRAKWETSLEKFAQLIVQDVLNEVLQAMDDGMDVYYTVADKFRS